MERSEQATAEPEIKSSLCVACGQPFVCGAVAGLATCWCMEKPSGLFAPEAGARCYCPQCLEQRIVSAQSAQAS
jgi:hypothetical protein